MISINRLKTFLNCFHTINSISIIDSVNTSLFHFINSTQVASPYPSIPLFFVSIHQFQQLHQFIQSNQLQRVKQYNWRVVHFTYSLRSISFISTMSSVNAIDYFVSDIPFHQSNYSKYTHPTIFIGSLNSSSIISISSIDSSHSLNSDSNNFIISTKSIISIVSIMTGICFDFEGAVL